MEPEYRMNVCGTGLEPTLSCPYLAAIQCVGLAAKYPNLTLLLLLLLLVVVVVVLYSPSALFQFLDHIIFIVCILLRRRLNIKR
jgi:hypothetical protein